MHRRRRHRMGRAAARRLSDASSFVAVSGGPDCPVSPRSSFSSPVHSPCSASLYHGSGPSPSRSRRPRPNDYYLPLSAASHIAAFSSSCLHTSSDPPFLPSPVFTECLPGSPPSAAPHQPSASCSCLSHSSFSPPSLNCSATLGQQTVPEDHLGTLARLRTMSSLPASMSSFGCSPHLQHIEEPGKKASGSVSFFTLRRTGSESDAAAHSVASPRVTHLGAKEDFRLRQAASCEVPCLTHVEGKRRPRSWCAEGLASAESAGNSFGSLDPPFSRAVFCPALIRELKLQTPDVAFGTGLDSAAVRAQDEDAASVAATRTLTSLSLVSSSSTEAVASSLAREGSPRQARLMSRDRARLSQGAPDSLSSPRWQCLPLLAHVAAHSTPVPFPGSPGSHRSSPFPRQHGCAPVEASTISPVTEDAPEHEDQEPGGAVNGSSGPAAAPPTTGGNSEGDGVAIARAEGAQTTEGGPARWVDSSAEQGNQGNAGKGSLLNDQAWQNAAGTPTAVALSAEAATTTCSAGSPDPQAGSNAQTSELPSRADPSDSMLPPTASVHAETGASERNWRQLLWRPHGIFSLKYVNKFLEMWGGDDWGSSCSVRLTGGADTPEPGFPHVRHRSTVLRRAETEHLEDVDGRGWKTRLSQKLRDLSGPRRTEKQRAASGEPSTLRDEQNHWGSEQNKPSVGETDARVFGCTSPPVDSRADGCSQQGAGTADASGGEAEERASGLTKSWSRWRCQDLAKAATAGTVPERQDSSRFPGPSTFRKFGQSPLQFDDKLEEEAYRRYLNRLFPFRLMVVGIVLLLVEVLQISWRFVQRGFLVDGRGDYYHYYGIVNFDLIFVIISVCLAIHVVLYGLLAGGGRIPKVKERLESWSFAMILLAFFTRVTCMVCVAFMGRSAGEGSPESSAEQRQGMSEPRALSSELVLLSLCCLFHIIVIDMVLPVRTLPSAPMHIVHFLGCVGCCIMAVCLYPQCISSDGPICALSSCLFILCGFLGRAQMEVSHRQLYMRWKHGLQRLRAAEEKLFSHHTARTGIERLAMLIRQSQVLLRFASLGDASRLYKNFALERVADIQGQVLHIVTDVHNVYHAQMNKEEMSELLRFVPEGQDVGHSLFLELRRRSASFSGSGATFRTLPSQGNSQGCPPADSTSFASPGCGTQTPPLGGGHAPLQGSSHAPASSGGGVSGAGHGFGRGWTSEALTRQRSVLHNGLFTVSDSPECSILTKTDGLSDGLRAAIGVDWDLDFFELDEKVGGNALRVTGEMQLLPLLRSEGLRCGPNVLGCFLHCLQQQYCPSNPYHNQLHAAMVSHACLIIVNEVLPSKQALTYVDEVCLAVASLAHDVGHPGLNNQYLISSQSLLATTYNDIAVLENYHAACCFRTAGFGEDHNIFRGLAKDAYQYIRQNIIGLILSTDMSKHISYVSRLRVRSRGKNAMQDVARFECFAPSQAVPPEVTLVAGPERGPGRSQVRTEAGNFDLSNDGDRWLLFQACIKAADLAHTATRWEQHQRWTECLCEEFYKQGDEELRQGMTVLEIFDRRQRHRFPQSQYRFIEIVVEPLFHGVRSAEDLLKGRGGIRRQITKYLADNLRRWKAVAQGAEANQASTSEDPKNQAASSGDAGRSGSVQSEGRETNSTKAAPTADAATRH
ncbi:3 5 -cyclic nucleotide phosphodiesterase domain-containing protein [Cystoisospora suis]|uniref:Phosphodiesterase n=1 Tax=Cystoisospora suis TaxID=483139 RepID=A0A2C6L7M7_9APIC|nr:3 5 -cyclic nucleotide phosphodiesterase domain-containing protein [Cystoisospora suis]